MIVSALSEHTVQGHHWQLVDGLQSVSLDQAVHIPGVDSPLEPEGWAVVIDQLSDLILHCCQSVALKEWSLMFALRLQCVQDLWLLVCLWSVQWWHKPPQLLEVCKVPAHQVKGYVW